MKKTKANISMYDIFTLPQQHDLLIDTFNSQKKTTVAVDNSPKTMETREIHNVEIKDAINATSIGTYSRS
jgi:hypothetical protein